MSATAQVMTALGWQKSSLRSILKDAAFAPPQALRQLASIPEFDVFVSTTFD